MQDGAITEKDLALHELELTVQKLIIDYAKKHKQDNDECFDTIAELCSKDNAKLNRHLQSKNVYYIEWCNGDTYQPSREVLCFCSEHVIAKRMIEHFLEWRQKVGKNLPLAPEEGEAREQYWKSLRKVTKRAPWGWGIEKEFLGNSKFVDMTEFHSPEQIVTPEDWSLDGEDWYKPHTYTIKQSGYYET